MDPGATVIAADSERSRFSNVNRRLEAWNRATRSVKPAIQQSPPPPAVTPWLITRVHSYKASPASTQPQPRDLGKTSQHSSIERRSMDKPSYFPRRKSLPDFAAAGRDPWSPCSPLDRCATPNPPSESSQTDAPAAEVSESAEPLQSNRDQAEICRLATGHVPACQGGTCDAAEEAADAASVKYPEAGARCSEASSQCRADGDGGGEAASGQQQTLQKQGNIAHRRGFSVTCLENSAEARGADNQRGRRGGSGSDLDSMMRRECICFSSRECGCMARPSGGSSNVRSPLCEVMATAPPVFVWAARRRMETRAAQKGPVTSCVSV